MDTENTGKLPGGRKLSPAGTGFGYKLGYLLLMCVYGCLGPIVRGIDMPATVIACLRAWIAVLALGLFILLSGRRYSREEIRKVLGPMLISGVLLAVDWCGLFASYSYTTVASATVCYYMTPLFVLVGAAVLLHERLTLRAVLCIAAAVAGMFFVSGAAENGLPSFSELRGIGLALFGAAGYTGVVLINKRFPEGDQLLRTFLQILATSIVMTPYVLLTADRSAVHVTAQGIILLILLGVGVTAAAYIAYFTLIIKIPSRSVALFAYADPVVAVLISVFFLGEKTSAGVILGAVLIIGAAVVSELPARRNRRQKDPVSVDR